MLDEQLDRPGEVDSSNCGRMGCVCPSCVRGSYRIRLVVLRLICLGFGLTLSGCERGASPAAKAPPPATVAVIAHEDQFNTIKLTVDAERRLGITTAPVEIRPVERMRGYGGEIVLPTGASIVVSAPMSGTIQAAGKTILPVGETLKAQQPVFLLTPLLSPERSVLTPAERIRFAEARNTVAQSQIDADGQVRQTQVQVDAAKIGLERAERLLREQAGTARAVDDARAQLSLAEKTLEAAESRKKLVDNIQLDEKPGTLAALVIQSPREGIMRTEHVAPGEVVAAGAPLFEIMDYDPVWVRVSVYAGDVRDLALTRQATVVGIADRHTDVPQSANPIPAPPTAVPLASAVDLYYELPNPDGKLKPGERVTARLVVEGKPESPTVPWSAVIQDINGGEWVYEQVAPQTFVRRRVRIRYVDDGTAVLAVNPLFKGPVVTAGAIELFGTEVGFAK